MFFGAAGKIFYKFWAPLDKKLLKGLLSQFFQFFFICIHLMVGLFGPLRAVGRYARAFSALSIIRPCPTAT
jgi:hypothetical protein